MIRLGELTARSGMVTDCLSTLNIGEDIPVSKCVHSMINQHSILLFIMCLPVTIEPVTNHTCYNVYSNTRNCQGILDCFVKKRMSSFSTLVCLLTCFFVPVYMMKMLIIYSNTCSTLLPNCTSDLERIVTSFSFCFNLIQVVMLFFSS